MKSSVVFSEEEGYVKMCETFCFRSVSNAEQENAAMEVDLIKQVRSNLKVGSTKTKLAQAMDTSTKTQQIWR